MTESGGVDPGRRMQVQRSRLCRRHRTGTRRCSRSARSSGPCTTRPFRSTTTIPSILVLLDLKMHHSLSVTPICRRRQHDRFHTDRLSKAARSQAKIEMHHAQGSILGFDRGRRAAGAWRGLRATTVSRVPGLGVQRFSAATGLEDARRVGVCAANVSADFRRLRRWRFGADSGGAGAASIGAKATRTGPSTIRDRTGT